MQRKRLPGMPLMIRMVFGISLLSVAGCSHTDKPKPEVVVPVRTVTAEPSVVTSALHYVGTIEEESGAALSFKVQGNVRHVYVREGQCVTKGSLLADIDNETLQQSFNAAKATYEQAEDALKRMQLLHDNHSLADIKFVEAQTQMEKADAMYRIARQNLEDTRLNAPVDGVIGRRTIEAGENVLPGQPVFTLLNIQSVNVRIAVPEREIGLLSLQTPAAVDVPAAGDSLYKGHICEKGIAADPATHTYEVRIRLDNRQGTLMPGMVCNVTVIRPGTTASAGIILPNRCVQVDDEGNRFVWCVEKGKATAVKVETGALTPDGITVRNGLPEGMKVICEGIQKVSEGTKVRIL